LMLRVKGFARWPEPVLSGPTKSGLSKGRAALDALVTEACRRRRAGVADQK
jgi:hypothetical protein